jgi:hypothetical protein
VNVKEGIEGEAHSPMTFQRGRTTRPYNRMGSRGEKDLWLSPGEVEQG